MKIFAKKRIFAAETSGTTWYVISKDQLLNNIFFRNNVWAEYVINTYDFDEFLNLESLEGSFIFDDKFYFLDSDYRQIEVNGNLVEPETAFEQYDVESLSEYIDENPSKEIIDRVTDSDIKWNIINVEEVAKILLDDETLTKIAIDAEDLGLIKF